MKMKYRERKHGNDEGMEKRGKEKERYADHIMKKEELREREREREREKTKENKCR